MTKSYILKLGLLAVATVLGGSLSASAQGRITITGTVTDGQRPMVGVSVIVNNSPTPVGTSTGADGKYTLQVPSQSSQLTASFLGYRSQTVTVGSQNVINFVLEEDSQTIDDVVVVGYGTQVKSHLTGAIAKIDASAFADSPVSDVTVALQGQIPGLSIDNLTSEVGVSPQIRVRGLGSISASSEPLVVVDGFPVPGGLQMVNQSDIQSIEVLKDASSAAIYGSRAANGVILITTKSGTTDNARYTVKAYTGFKYAYQLHDLMTQQEALNLMNWQESVGGVGANGQYRAAAWLEQNLGYTDWQREALRDYTGISNVQFSVSGGKNDTKYYVSSAITHDEGIMLQNMVDKVNFRSKFDTKFSKHVSFGSNVSATYQHSTRPFNNFIDFYRTPSFLPVKHNELSTAMTGYTGYARGSHFVSIATPTGAPDAFGNPTWETSSPFSSGNPNPRSVMDNSWRGGEVFQTTGNIYLTVDIIKGLQFKTSNGFNFRFGENTSYENFGARKDQAPSTGSYGNSLYLSLLSENTLNYTKKWGAHDISALVGYTLQNDRSQRAGIVGTGFPSDDIHTLNTASIFDSEGTYTYRFPNILLESFLARVNYAYDNKYLVSAVARLDRSSLFTAGHRNAWFPSVSLGWRASQEDFLKPVSWISNLKVRASYGVTGNNDVSHLATYDVISTSNYILGPGTGTLTSGSANTSSSLANAAITWEQVDEFNVGLDAGFLHDRINLSVDMYYSVTRSLLLSQPAQSFTGFQYSWNNIGRIRNKGIEASLETVNFKGRDFKWNTTFNIAANRNRLLEWGGERQTISLGERAEEYISIVGGQFIQFYGYKVIGVWNSAEEIAANPHMEGTDVPGGPRVWDANGDGVINAEDYVPLGSPYPDFTYGLTNNLKYKNFDLSFMFQGVQGVTVFNGDVYYVESHKWNKAYIKDRWTSPSEPGDGMTPYAQNGIAAWYTSNPLEDASYICLRNVTLGYTFDNAMVKKIGLRGLRVYASGNNLWYYWGSGYKGINPESRYTTGDYASKTIAGYQRGGFPLTSTITFGIDVNF